MKSGVSPVAEAYSATAFLPELASYSREAALVASLGYAFEYYQQENSPCWRPRINTPDDADQSVVERMYDYYALLEDLPDAEETSEAAKPALTVTMPLAILGEDIATPLRALELIQAERAYCDGDIEVVLWANAGFQGRYEESQIVAKARNRYQDLRTALADQTTKGVRVRTALEVFELPISQSVPMSQLRANYMEAVTVDAIERGFGYDHPVLWLDADTTDVGKGSLQQIITSVRQLDSYFIHADTRYSIDWAHGTPFNKLDDASKAVAISEVLRRCFVRNGMERAYDEECGLAFALGTYLFSGGVSTQRPIGEAHDLLNQAVHGRIRPYPHIVEALAIETPIDSAVRYLPKARVGTSARRHLALVQQKGAQALVDADTTDYGQPFTALGSHRKELWQKTAVPITREDMDRLVVDRAREIRHFSPATLFYPDKLEPFIGPASRLIGKYFEDASAEATS